MIWNVVALNWRCEHAKHVSELTANDGDPKKAYRPSDEDLHRPDLWKGAHWRWLDRMDAKH
jgi:hypothetical protein